VPKYIAPWEGRDDPLRERFPLQLLTPHPKHRTHSIYGNLPWIREISAEGVHLNAADAASRGIAEGDLVRIFNDRGATVVRAYLTERVMPDVAVIQQGMPVLPRSDGVDIGGSANVLTSQRPTPWAKGPTTHTTLVQVAKEGAAPSESKEESR
jgi:anaerobic dimethyl sulfoxide reductase subunit A